MFRIGIKFSGLKPSQQILLDRHVFHLMRKEARQKRQSGGMHRLLSADRTKERRGAHRVEICAGDLDVLIRKIESGDLPSLDDQARMASDILKPPEQRSKIAVGDLSTTGCSLILEDKRNLSPGDIVLLKLMREEAELEVRARVIYVTQLPLGA